MGHKNGHNSGPRASPRARIWHAPSYHIPRKIPVNMPHPTHGAEGLGGEVPWDARVLVSGQQLFREIQYRFNGRCRGPSV